MNTDFNMEELYRAIKAIKENSAPERDNIEYKMIKELTDIYLK